MYEIMSPTHQEWVEEFVEIYKSEPYLRNLKRKDC